MGGLIDTMTCMGLLSCWNFLHKENSFAHSLGMGGRYTFYETFYGTHQTGPAWQWTGAGSPLGMAKGGRCAGAFCHGPCSQAFGPLGTEVHPWPLPLSQHKQIPSSAHILPPSICCCPPLALPCKPSLQTLQKGHRSHPK